MSTIAQVSRTMQQLLTTEADRLARTTGFIRRQRQLTGASFVQALVFGFLGNPTLSIEQLAQTATAVGTPISAQGLDQRFTRSAAACLKQVLGTAMRQLIAGDPVAIPLFQRFNGVYVLDSTTIMLPDALESEWRGNGGSTTKGTVAALKVQVLWNLSTGTLQHVSLADGRSADATAPVQTTDLPAGALRIADLGYFGLPQLQALRDQGVEVLSRFQTQVAIFDQSGERRDLLTVLAADAQTVDLPVTIGATERIPVRLLAERVPQEVADQRRRRLRATWRDKGRPASPRQLALAGWTIMLTTVAPDQLSLPQARMLLRARWQVELLFKLWKSHGQVDTWRSQQPWRIMCEVYAKLLAMLVLHWVLIVGCWQQATRSLRKAAQTIQAHALVLAYALSDSPQSLAARIHLIRRCLRHGPQVTTRGRRSSTAHLLLAALESLS